MKRGCSEKNNLLFIVKSLSLPILKKYGMLTLEPKFLVSENDGFKNPDLLSTVGSG